MDPSELLTLSETVARLLQSRELKVVLAESCTAGLVAAALGQVPGISDYLCGSAVTYRSHTKEQWLGVAAAHLQRPGPVSLLVTKEMACAVLERTSEADLSVAVTGHLGPQAPPALDGLVFTAAARRQPNAPPVVIRAQQHRLGAGSRPERQQQAAFEVLSQLQDVLANWA